MDFLCEHLQQWLAFQEVVHFHLSILFTLYLCEDPLGSIYHELDMLQIYFAEKLTPAFLNLCL